MQAKISWVSFFLQLIDHNPQFIYRSADTSLARPGRKQANVSVNGVNFLRCLALQKKKLDDSSRLDVVEIARVPDMLPSLFPSLSGLRTYQHPGRK